MTTLLDQLYQFTMENRITAYLTDKEYYLAQKYRREHRETLVRHLDGEGLKVLELYEDARAEEDWFDSMALFRAALSLGLELSRL